MLIILLVFAFIRTLNGGPLFSPPQASDAFPNPGDQQVHFGQRGVNDIVISCFATIFACTWSAVHPNIPGPMDCWWTRSKRQVLTMTYALLAPEAMTGWALRQRLAARQIIEHYNAEIIKNIRNPEPTNACKRNSVLDTIKEIFQDSPLPPEFKEGDSEPPWTLTQGFFLQMGGFILCENRRPIQTLTSGSSEKNDTTIEWNIQNGIIDVPRISEEDIQDRSKGDAITKIFIMLQTTWFIVQCIARWSQGLQVTELEVVALGFAMLNGITYGLWWNKPQNVGRPVFLESKKPRGLDKNSAYSNIVPTSGLPEVTTSEHSGAESWVRRKLQQELKEHAGSGIQMLIWFIPLGLLEALVRPLNKTISEYRTTTMHSDLRVAMFYSALSNRIQLDQTLIITSIIGTTFGSVHLIPSWSLAFSSHQEMWLWRVSAAITTVEPMVTGLCFYFDSVQRKSLVRVYGTSMTIGVPLYIIARIILLIHSLTSLRSLPPTAFLTIKWTTFIPHI